MLGRESQACESSAETITHAGEDEYLIEGTVENVKFSEDLADEEDDH